MSVPPGWYRDSAGAMRYWDGSGWTQSVEPGAGVEPDPGRGPTHGHGQAPVQPSPYPGAPASPPGAPAPYPGTQGQVLPPPRPGHPAQHQLHPSPQPGRQVQPYGPQVAASHYAPITGPPVKLRNGLGTAGFVVSLVSVFLPFIFGLVGGIVGLTLSCVGLSRQHLPKGLAIAGVVLGILAIILIF